MQSLAELRKRISQYLLFASLVFVLCFLFEKQLCNICRELYSKLQVAGCAIKGSCNIQSEALDRSVSKAPLTPSLSQHFLHFSNITREQKTLFVKFSLVKEQYTEILDQAVIFSYFNFVKYCFDGMYNSCGETADLEQKYLNFDTDFKSSPKE